ncbi:MAG: hypothetical protein WAX89_07580 [Alphaproteobacteria bacterium]
MFGFSRTRKSEAVVIPEAPHLPTVHDAHTIVAADDHEQFTQVIDALRLEIAQWLEGVQLKDPGAMREYLCGSKLFELTDFYPNEKRFRLFFSTAPWLNFVAELEKKSYTLSAQPFKRPTFRHRVKLSWIVPT